MTKVDHVVGLGTCACMFVGEFGSMNWLSLIGSLFGFVYFGYRAAYQSYTSG